MGAILRVAVELIVMSSVLVEKELDTTQMYAEKPPILRRMQ